jgi:membrane protease YdiL (CAAX protease family)
MEPLPLSLYVLGGLAAATWVALLAGGLPAVALERRRGVPWSAVDVAAVFGVYFLPTALAAGVALVARLAGGAGPALEAAPAEAGGPLWNLIASSLTKIALAGLALALMRFRAGADAGDLGWRADSAVRDAAMGVLTFCAVAAPIYGLHLAVQGRFPSEHPLVDAVRRHPHLFPAYAAAAVVVAPVVEEVLFRLLLQGWLERVFAREIAAGRGSGRGGEFGGDGAPPRREAAAEPSGPAGGASILVASLVFAAIHPWPDSVPLFFFAIALGWLYWRTHRLLPCIVLHAALNGFSMFMLWMGP